MATIRARASAFFKAFHKYSPGFRRKLQMNLIWATLSILLIVFWLEWSMYRTVRSNIAREWGRQLQQQSEQPFKVLAQYVVDASLKRIRTLGEEGKIDLTDFSTLSRQMLFALTKVPLKATLQIADEDGRELLMFRNGMAWQTRMIRDGSHAEWKRWEGEELVDDGWTTAFKYDPRAQDWYLAASGEEVAWIIPAKMPGIQESSSAISASLRWESAGNTFVTALHIPLHEILTLIHLFSGNERGIIFGHFEGGEFVVVTGLYDPDLYGSAQTGEALSAEAEHEARAVIAEFMKQWRQQNDSNKEAVEDVTMNGIQWWVGAKQITLGTQHFWLGVAFPEKSVSSDIRREQKTMASVLIGTVALALIVLGIQLRFFLKTSKEIEAEYIQRQERKQGILQVIERGESTRLEFKSTIRWNLKTNKAGKGIEIAWLKTVAAYLNSEGGTLLLGVRDDGEVLGLEADNFQNEDRLLLHVNNLLKQHVGLEF
ncbi:MAG: ATP-binding protein, partial [bacterium]|nr:ATP-binding protein [bacterium]